MLCRGAVEDVPVPDDVDDGDRWREGLYHITIKYELHVMLIPLCTLFVAW